MFPGTGELPAALADCGGGEGGTSKLSQQEAQGKNGIMEPAL